MRKIKFVDEKSFILACPDAICAQAFVLPEMVIYFKGQDEP
jgi:hypothetical protein